MREVVRRWVASNCFFEHDICFCLGAASVEFFLTWPAVEAWRWDSVTRRPLVLAEGSGSLWRFGFLWRF
jgi:hypothetical protein